MVTGLKWRLAFWDKHMPLYLADFQHMKENRFKKGRK